MNIHASILHPRLEHRSGEPLAGYVSRLAAFHTGTPWQNFLADHRIVRQSVVDGTDDGFVAVSRLSGVPVANFMPATSRRLGERRFQIGIESFPRAFLRRASVRACPACLREDHAHLDDRPEVACHHRYAWELASIRTCPEHAIALVEIGHADIPSQLGDFASALRDAWPRIDRLEFEADRREASSLEKYILRRIERSQTGESAHDNPMDQYPIYGAVRACEMIGTVIQHGTRVRLKSLRDDDWHAAGAVGYQILREGPERVRDWLSGVHAQAAVSDGHAGPQAIFGFFYQWLEFGDEVREAGFMRDILRDYIVSAMPVGHDDVVLGEPVRQRRMHSIRTLHETTGLHPKRLRKLLVDAELVAPDDCRSDNLIVFPAQEGEAIAEMAGNAIPLKAVESYLNCPRTHARLLKESGLISPVIDAEQRGRLARFGFATADLDSFLERLLRNAPPAHERDAKLADIPYAAKRCCCSAMQIVKLALDERLQNSRTDPAARGYLSLLVDVEEVRPLVRLNVEPEGFSLHEAERKLGTSTRVIRALIADGPNGEAPVLASKVAINPVNRCPQIIVPHQALADFEECYINLFRLSKLTGIHHRELLTRLERAGVRPAFDPAQFGARFYRRNETENALQLSGRNT